MVSVHSKDATAFLVGRANTVNWILMNVLLTLPIATPSSSVLTLAPVINADHVLRTFMIRLRLEQTAQ